MAAKKGQPSSMPAAKNTARRTASSSQAQTIRQAKSTPRKTAVPKTRELTVEERLDRIEAAFGPQLGVRLADLDAAAVLATAGLATQESQGSRPLTDAERLTRLELAAGAAGIRLYA